MPRPQNKKDLLDLSKNNYNALIDYVENLDPEIRLSNFKKGSLNRSIKDVLAHLHHWHLLLLQWYKVGMAGTKPNMPSEGYTWSMLPKLNLEIREKYQNWNLLQALKFLDESHAKVQGIISTHSNEELFTKKKYHWTGFTSLGAYLISNTSSHYAWALKLIKKQLKN